MELHIHLDVGELTKQLEPKLEKLEELTQKPIIPAGYRCQGCWKDDGNHESNCEFMLAQAVSS